MQHHIAILHYAAPPVIGGVESVLEQHARLFVQAGHRVRIVAAKGGAACAPADFYTFPLVGSQHEAILSAKKQLDQGVVPDDFEHLVETITRQMGEAFHGVDLIIAHNVCSLHKNLALTAALRRFCAQPDAPNLVIWHHDFAQTSSRYEGELHTGYPWNLLSEDWPEVDPTHVVISDLRQREFSSVFELPAGKAHVVPSGIDLHRFLNIGQTATKFFNCMALSHGDPVFLLPVRITRRKNIELAIEIVSELRSYFSNPTLVITGPPGAHNQDNQRYLRELIDLRDCLGLTPGYSLKGSVHFMAEWSDRYLPVDVVQDFFRMVDGLLLPSFEEGFGIPMLEAGLAGIPVFASDIPSLRAIGHQAATWFDPNGNPTEIAAKIKNRLCGDPVFALKKRVRREFVWEGVYKKHIAPLLECVV